MWLTLWSTCDVVILRVGRTKSRCTSGLGIRLTRLLLIFLDVFELGLTAPVRYLFILVYSDRIYRDRL